MAYSVRNKTALVQEFRQPVGLRRQTPTGAFQTKHGGSYVRLRPKAPKSALPQSSKVSNISGYRNGRPVAVPTASSGGNHPSSVSSPGSLPKHSYVHQYGCRFEGGRIGFGDTTSSCSHPSVGGRFGRPFRGAATTRPCSVEKFACYTRFYAISSESALASFLAPFHIPLTPVPSRSLVFGAKARPLSGSWNLYKMKCRPQHAQPI